MAWSLETTQDHVEPKGKPSNAPEIDDEKAKTDGHKTQDVKTGRHTESNGEETRNSPNVHARP